MPNMLTPAWEKGFVDWAREWPSNVAGRVQGLLGFDPEADRQMAKTLYSHFTGIDPQTGQMGIPGFGFGGATRIYDAPTPGWVKPMNRKPTMTIMQNPTESEMRRMIADQRRQARASGETLEDWQNTLRWLEDFEGNKYVWPSMDAIHRDARDFLGLPRQVRRGLWDPDRGFGE